MKPMDRREARDVLVTWGELVRKYGEPTPEGWGWPGASVEGRMRHGSGGQAELTLPEGAIFMCQRQGHSHELVIMLARVISAMPWVTSIVLALKYVHQLDDASIRLQIGATERELRRHVETGEEIVFKVLSSLKSGEGSSVIALHLLLEAKERLKRFDDSQEKSPLAKKRQAV